MADKVETNVALCMPIGNKIDPRTMRSLEVLRHDNIPLHKLFLSGFAVDVARNMITHDALAQTKATHLLWIDSDMCWDNTEALNRLLKHDRDIVGGLCFARQHPYKPVIARFFHPSWGYDPGSIGWMWDYPKESLIEVDRTGGAFLLIKREVFEKIRERSGQDSYRDWWAPMADECHAEDLSFCKRAQEAGFKIYVDTGLPIGHVGEVVIGSDFSERNRAFEYHRHLAPLEMLIDAVATKPAGESPLPLAGPESACPLDLSKPLASVIIPTFNEEPQFLKAAILSALAQTVPVEVIVVDDGSKEPVTFEGPGAERVKIIRLPKNQGIAAALNTGIFTAMTTPWFAWLSSDDMFEPEKIEMQLTALINSGLKCCYTNYDIRADRHRGVKHPHFRVWNNMEEQHAILTNACVINGSTVLVHKSILDEVGPFDISFKYGQDWEMWCRIGQHHFWHGIPDKLTVRREFANLTTVIAHAAPDDERRLRRDSEDSRIRRMYAVRKCQHCGGAIGDNA